MEVHFIDVGCGNMTLLLFPNGTTYLYDCNVTSDNAEAVFGYLTRSMGQRTAIDTFICSHRDADHIRGIGEIHRRFPIQKIRDAGVPGATQDSREYREYMALRRRLLSRTIMAKKYLEVGDATIHFMNAGRDDTRDVNDQSIVMKVDYQGSSVLLAADTSFAPWKKDIVPHYGSRLQANILLAAHHGSLTFFDDPADSRHYYTDHMETISPAMTVISVGRNPHGLPDSKAVKLYKKYSTGSNHGHKVFRTDHEGHMKLLLRGSSHWTLSRNQ